MRRDHRAAVLLPRRRAHRAAADRDHPSSRSVRALCRRLRIRDRAPEGHRQPVQGTCARRPHRTGGQGAPGGDQPPGQLADRPPAPRSEAPPGRGGTYTGHRDRVGDHGGGRRTGAGRVHRIRRRIEFRSRGVGHRRTGGRMGGKPEPPPRPLPARPPPGRLRGAHRPGRGAGGRLHRAPIGLGSGPGPGHRPGRLGARQRRQLPAPRRSPPRQAGPGPHGRHQQGDRAAGRPAGQRRAGGHRHPDGPGPRLAVHPGARSVRPAAHRGGRRGSGPGLLRGAERGGPRAAARLRPSRVPAVAGPPRGDPPLPVHRHPLDARLLRLPGRGGDRLARARSRPGSPRRSAG